MTQKIEIEYNGVTLVEAEPSLLERSISYCTGCYFFELDTYDYHCQAPNQNCTQHNIIWKRKE